MAPFFETHTTFLATVPHRPGVYLMKGDGGAVLYVGKAMDLRKRLASYARHEGGDYSKTAVMLAKVDTIETILTRTEKEALILEASLIKKYRPKYNVILRDDKSYPYLKVTVNENWPRLVMTRQRSKDGARYFGPFASASAMWATLHHLQALFPLRRCRDQVLKEKSRPCLNYQIGRCLAPCVGKISEAAYGELVENVLMVLEGRNRQLLQDLQARMEQAAAELDFESAALHRDRIAAIRETLEKQVVVAAHSLDQDVFGYEQRGASVTVSVMLVRRGVMNGFISYYLQEPVGEKEEVLAEVLERYYGAERPVPHEILLPFAVSGQQALQEWLADLKGGRLVLAVPQRGDRLKLVQMATDNAGKVFEEADKKSRSWEALANALQHKLGLVRPPNRIECFDISNIGGRQAVGAMVCFEDGEKETGGFRHYKIQSVAGPDDYAMMSEALYRRFSKVDERLRLPDLLVIDGGKGHLQVAVNVLGELGLLTEVELISIAKEKGDEGEKLFKPGRKNPLLLKRNDPVLLFIMRVRDEAHHYGITFHRRWRRRKTLKSPLDEIPGIGPARKKQLLQVLGSMKRVGEATEAELSAVAGIGPELARQIHQALHGRPD